MKLIVGHMTFSLINELRKDLAESEQLITEYTAHAEHYRTKHAQLTEAIRILEANEKPKRRIYTIRNNEPLVKLIIPANKYESYRNFYPNDAIEVCVENDVILYAADSELEYDWRLSLTKDQNPQLFDDVLDMLEREEAMNAFRGKVKPITDEMLLEHPQHVMCTLVPSWNHIGAEVAVTKDET